ncbi:MAG: CAP domain-containing protein [Thermoleophilia bacterium]
MQAAKRPAVLIALICLFLLSSFGGIGQARSYDAEELEFLRLINNYRVQNGLSALQASDTAAEAAARHSLDMARFGFFDHTTLKSSFFPAGSSPWDRLRLTGYPTGGHMGENLAAGQGTAQQVFADWRGSPGHNRNMLDPEFRVIGIARRVVSPSSYGVYWTTDFGSLVDSSANNPVTAAGAPFTDVSRTDPELWDAAVYVKRAGLFEGYPSGALGSWEAMTRRHVALVLRRAGLGARPDWESDFRESTRGEVMRAFPGLTWDSGREDEPILRSQLVRLLYRAR